MDINCNVLQKKIHSDNFLWKHISFDGTFIGNISQVKTRGSERERETHLEIDHNIVGRAVTWDIGDWGAGPSSAGFRAGTWTWLAHQGGYFSKILKGLGFVLMQNKLNTETSTFLQETEFLFSCTHAQELSG